MLKLSCLLPLLVLTVCCSEQTHGAESPPNIVYMMSDELAYFEVSHMGSKIRTPHIDQFATEGMRFTQGLAGSCVCAPLRCTLMTGKHAGHASVRANDGGTPLRENEPTIATLLKQRGYATGGFGKWGCGGRDSTGVPEQHGFDVFFGYYDQVHAHTFYPPYLIRNSEEVVLPGNNGGRSGATYSQYEIMGQALQFIHENRDRPFFCYLPITPPHGNYDIPETDPAWGLYREDDWMQDSNVPQDAKNYAAMVSMVDRNLGQVLDLLRELELEDRTLVFFTGDNGGQDRFKSAMHPRGYFGPNVNPHTGVEFRGGKGNLYEGGLRIPFLARWPGHVPAGKVSDLLFYQPDVLPTLAELAGAEIPDDVDGRSILPTLLGTEGASQPTHEALYWEYGSQVAVRKGHWKAILPKKNGAWELYDLNEDISETRNVAADHPEILAAMQDFATRAHEPVQAGTYLDEKRVRHQRDRQAKTGLPDFTASARSTSGAPNTNWDATGLIPQTQVKLIRFSSENAENGRRAALAVDGNPDTLWHSQFAPKLIPPPHELVLDLGESTTVGGFRYLARQDNGWNGAFGKAEFYVSESAEEFGEPVASHTFTKVKTAQQVDLPEPVAGRYVLIKVLSEVNDNAFASAAEIGIVAAKTPTKK
ncbi:MAG: sulfatase-like hydrolase/transferase [Planctomycetaceae bacterium]|nr:sulfatase-like hydrolase/transferase [Planctomycetaceae bacterium]